jgi:hypothetical protein
MAYNPFRIYRIPNTLKDKEAEHLRQTRDAVARCIDILKAPLPDTFAKEVSGAFFKGRGMVGARACAPGQTLRSSLGTLSR